MGAFNDKRPHHKICKTTECRATGVSGSSRSFLWKAHEASTVAETFQKRVFFLIERPHGKIKKPPNAEPQGIPEALDRLVGMLIEFSTISRRQGLKPFRKVGGWVD
jgi:hypothetical protein